MIYTVTLNPALDKTVQIPHMHLDGVNRITTMRTDPGGKGINVSKVIAKLGGESVALALLGGNTGKRIADVLEALGLPSLLTFVPGETRTNLKIVDPVQHTNTDINEPGLEVDGAVLEKMLASLLELLRPEDIVVLSGSLPKGAPADTYAHWICRCKAAGAKVFLDADGQRLAAGLKAAPDLIKPNREELSELVGSDLETLEDLVTAGRQLLTDGIQKAVISLGGQGAVFLTKERSLYAHSLSVPVGSTVGAGDSVVAALAVAEARGLSLEETVRLAMATGAANVMCSGSQAAEYETIESLLDQVTWQEIC